MQENIKLDALILNQKIKNEKRKRYQVYQAMDYLRSHTNKFDFFSSDSIKILKTGSALSIKFEQEKLTTEILLLSFFNTDSEVLKILKKFNISSEKLEKHISYAYQINQFATKKASTFSSFSKNFQFSLAKENSFLEKIEYNYEVKILLQKSIENAYRFKTPVITPEILFLTLLEEKNMSAGSLLKVFLKNDLEWNLLRYEILKKLHNQETKIQGNLSKNFRYFAYLLKIEFNDSQFEKLLKKPDFSLIISTYRDLVISKVLEIDLFNLLESDIKTSVKINNIRKYSN